MDTAPDRLTKAIQDELLQGRLVPVVGAGVSKHVAEIPLWRGVIEHAIGYVQESGTATQPQLDSARQLLAGGKLIRAAEVVRKILEAPNGEFPAWLARCFGITRKDVPAERTHTIDSIVNLQCPVITTTNYDKLLSELHYEYFPDITWLEPPLMQVAVRDGNHILHLHGVYDRPESVIFGRSDYKRIVADEAYRMVLETLWLHKTLLFIGCSFDGLKDPDLSRLLTWASSTFKGTRYKHYALLRTESYTVEDARKMLNRWRIQVVPFGNSYEDLPLWLDAMNPNLGHAQSARAQKPDVRRGPDIPRYMRYVRQTVQDAIATHPLSLHKAPTALEMRLYTMKVEREDSGVQTSGGVLLWKVLSHSPQLALIGEPGSGKSQMLRQEALAMCEAFERVGEREQGGPPDVAEEPEFRVPVLVSLNDYSGQSIEELIRGSFQIAGVDIEGVAIEQMVRDGTVYLLLDDLDWVRPEYAPGLYTALKSWRRMYTKCRLVVSSQRLADGHRLEIPTYTVSPLAGEDISQFLTGALGLKDEDALAIKEGLPEEFRELLSLPLTLKMLALVYQQANHIVPQSRSALYSTCVQVLLDQSEARGHILIERSDKIRLLSLLATWMQDNDVYNLSASDFSNLLHQWVNDAANQYGVAHLRTVDMLQLRTELLQSELFRFAPEGGIEFIHRTFASYMAALQIRAAHLSELVPKESWTTSLLLWASMYPLHVTDAIMPLVSGRPALLGQFIKERNAQRKGSTDSAAPIGAAEWFGHFVRYYNRLFGQFRVLGDPRWGTALPPGRLEALVAASDEGKGYALLWRSSADAPEGSVVWGNSKALADHVASLRLQMPQEITLSVWSFPCWLIENYHPLEAAYNWVMRLLLDRLLMTPWTWHPPASPLPGVDTPHPAVTKLMEKHIYYQAFIEGLPSEVREKLPFYAQSGFAFIADVDESPRNPSVTYTFMPAEGSEMRVFQQVFDSSTGRGDSAMLIRGADNRWTTTMDGVVRPVLRLWAYVLDGVLEGRTTDQAEGWIFDDLAKYLPGFPPETW